jgi:DNA (cytosine-5)-methyltransferase 1
VECIIDFGEKGFPGVLIETIALFINNNAKVKNTRVVSVTHGINQIQIQRYIFDETLPYWTIYRNSLFDEVCKKLDFSKFTVFRDRQITNTQVSLSGDIRVLKSRNINDLGTEIIDIEGYDSYINEDKARNLSVYSFLDRDDVYLTPNMTYKPRVIKKPKGVLVNGSVAILVPKDKTPITDEQCLYFSSEEYRKFYQIARNYQTRSLNVDACSVFYYGLLRTELKKQPITEKFAFGEQISLFGVE